MFNKVVLDILNLFSAEPAAVASQMPSMEVGMIAKAYFGIDPKSLVRGLVLYPTPEIKMIIAVHNNSSIEKIMNDVIISNGVFAVAFVIPYNRIETTDGNAINAARLISAIVTSYVEIISYSKRVLLEQFDGGKAALILYQAVPVLVTEIMRKLYVGPTLPSVIASTLRLDTNKYSIITEQWIETIISILEDDNSVEDLLDNGFICAIPPNSKTYPGLWPTFEIASKEEEEETSND